MTLRRTLSALLFATLMLSAATAGAVNPFGRSGFELTNSDVPLVTEATRPFFEDATVPVGTVKSWSNPKSGNGGTATLVDRFEQKGMPCVRIQHDIKLKTVADPFRFVIDRCRVADGSWKML
jgi:surface antigen